MLSCYVISVVHVLMEVHQSHAIVTTGKQWRSNTYNGYQIGHDLFFSTDINIIINVSEISQGTYHV